jgi:hypothetical protein
LYIVSGSINVSVSYENQYGLAPAANIRKMDVTHVTFCPLLPFLKVRNGTEKMRDHYFLIPRLDPFLTLKKVTVGIFEFTRCVDWGFHKNLNQAKKTAESVTLFCFDPRILTTNLARSQKWGVWSKDCGAAGRLGRRAVEWKGLSNLLYFYFKLSLKI